MKNTRLIILGIIVLVLGFLYFYDAQPRNEPPFKSVNLEQENYVINNTMPSFYDTIIHLGLKELGLKGVSVTVERLSDQAKQTFDGELNAHIRYIDGGFYLFIDPLNKKRAITIISHELIHVKQYLDETFKYDDGKITWNGQTYLLDDINYDDRPWETEAFQLESQLASHISEIVY